MPKVNGLTDKQRAFCRAYVANNGNGTRAYLTAYDSKSTASASTESMKLLKRDDITEYINELQKPLDNLAQNERQRKRSILWDMITDPNTKDSDRLGAMNILCKIDGTYTTQDDGKQDDMFQDMATDKIIKLIG